MVGFFRQLFRTILFVQNLFEGKPCIRQMLCVPYTLWLSVKPEERPMQIWREY